MDLYSLMGCGLGKKAVIPKWWVENIFLTQRVWKWKTVFLINHFHNQFLHEAGKHRRLKVPRDKGPRLDSFALGCVAGYTHTHSRDMFLGGYSCTMKLQKSPWYDYRPFSWSISMPPRSTSKSLIKVINNSAWILVNGEQLDILLQIQGTVISAPNIQLS